MQKLGATQNTAQSSKFDKLVVLLLPECQSIATIEYEVESFLTGFSMNRVVDLEVPNYASVRNGRNQGPVSIVWSTGDMPKIDIHSFSSQPQVR